MFHLQFRIQRRPRTAVAGDRPVAAGVTAGAWGVPVWEARQVRTMTWTAVATVAYANIPGLNAREKRVDVYAGVTQISLVSPATLLGARWEQHVRGQWRPRTRVATRSPHV